MSSQPVLIHDVESLRSHGTKAPLMSAAKRGASEDELASLLKLEEDDEREADRAYWAPLRAELDRLRHARPRGDH